MGAPSGQIAAEPDVELARPIDDYDLPALVIGSVSDNRAELGWVEGYRAQTRSAPHRAAACRAIVPAAR